MHKSAFSLLNFTLISKNIFVKHGKRLNIHSFSQKISFVINKCDRPKLICFIMKCCYNAWEDQMEETLKNFLIFKFFEKTANSIC